MSCIFENCSNTKYFCKNTDVRFFQVPTIPYMRKKWLEACNVTDERLSKTLLVCSNHFDPKDIIKKETNVRLNRSAIPKSTRYTFDQNYIINVFTIKNVGAIFIFYP